MQYTLLLAALSGSALAKNLVAAPQRLEARQDLSFTPITTLTSSCRSGEFICPVKYNGLGYCASPARGVVCCAQGYTCPAQSFCLIDGKCCPNGVDPARCAAEKGVKLPPGFKPGNTIAFTPTSAPAASSPTKTSTTAGTSTATKSTVTTTTAVATPYYVNPSNATSTRPAASGTGARQPSVKPFTGGASALSFGDFGIVAAFAGMGGLLL